MPGPASRGRRPSATEPLIRAAPPSRLVGLGSTAASVSQRRPPPQSKKPSADGREGPDPIEQRRSGRWRRADPPDDPLAFADERRDVGDLGPERGAVALAQAGCRAQDLLEGRGPVVDRRPRAFEAHHRHTPGRGRNGGRPTNATPRTPGGGPRPRLRAACSAPWPGARSQPRRRGRTAAGLQEVSGRGSTLTLTSVSTDNVP